MSAAATTDSVLPVWLNPIRSLALFPAVRGGRREDWLKERDARGRRDGKRNRERQEKRERERKRRKDGSLALFPTMRGRRREEREGKGEGRSDRGR